MAGQGVCVSAERGGPMRRAARATLQCASRPRFLSERRISAAAPSAEGRRGSALRPLSLFRAFGSARGERPEFVLRNRQSRRRHFGGAFRPVFTLEV